MILHNKTELKTAKKKIASTKREISQKDWTTSITTCQALAFNLFLSFAWILSTDTIEPSCYKYLS